MLGVMQVQVGEESPIPVVVALVVAGVRAAPVSSAMVVVA